MVWQTFLSLRGATIIHAAPRDPSAQNTGLLLHERNVIPSHYASEGPLALFHHLTSKEFPDEPERAILPFAQCLPIPRPRCGSIWRSQNPPFRSLTISPKGHSLSGRKRELGLGAVYGRGLPPLASAF